MNNIIMCGIDVHDKSLICMIGRNKKKPKKKDFPNTLCGRKKLFNDLHCLSRVTNNCRILVVYEASGLGYGLADECAENNIECAVLAPTKLPFSLKHRKTKTDARDANMLYEVLRGHVLAGNDLPKVWIPSEKLRAERDLVRGRLKLGEDISAVKLKILSFIKKNKIPKYTLHTNWTKAHRNWLKSLKLSETNIFILTNMIERLEYLEKELIKWDEMIHNLSRESDYVPAVLELEKNITGVSTLTAMVFLTELGDLNRFNNRKELGSYIGLTPKSFESGNNDNRKGHITRDGSSRIRKVLCQAMWCRLRYVPKDKIYYDKIVKKNPNNKKKALVACMRKLGILMWHIAKDGYSKTYLDISNFKELKTA